jgi:hypothetical protein
VAQVEGGLFKGSINLHVSFLYTTTRLAVADAVPVTSVAVTVTVYVPRGVF